MKESLEEKVTIEELIEQTLESLKDKNDDLMYLYEQELLTYSEYLIELEHFGDLAARIIQILRNEQYVKVNGTSQDDDGLSLQDFFEIERSASAGRMRDKQRE
jgi:hypothetical protein